MTGKRRAAWGESSVWKGADGYWHGAVSVGVGHDGRRLRKHVQAARRVEVVKRVRELERQRDAGPSLILQMMPSSVLPTISV